MSRGDCQRYELLGGEHEDHGVVFCQPNGRVRTAGYAIELNPCVDGPEPDMVVLSDERWYVDEACGFIARYCRQATGPIFSISFAVLERIVW